MPVSGSRCCSELMSETVMNGFCQGHIELEAQSSPLLPAVCALAEARRLNTTGHKIPGLHSFNKIVSMAVSFILLLSASTLRTAAGSFLEDCVNSGSVPGRKRFRARKPGESLVLCFLALRPLARYLPSLASVFSGGKKYVTVSAHLPHRIARGQVRHSHLLIAMRLTFLTCKSDHGMALYRTLHRPPALGGQSELHSVAYEALWRKPQFTSLASFPPSATHEPSTPNNIFPWFHSHHITCSQRTLQDVRLLCTLFSLTGIPFLPPSIAQVSPPYKAGPDCSGQTQLLHPGYSHSIMHHGPCHT